MIYRGYIQEIKEGGKKAKVKGFQGKILDNLFVLYPYGDSSNIEIGANSLCWIFAPLGDETNAFVIPFNTELQPSLEPTEKAVGNFKVGNKVTFKANGDIVVDGEADFIAQSLANLNIQASTKITLNAPTVEITDNVDLGDALGLVLNNLATMQVVIPSGSSAGTYPVAIVNAGQTKVNA